MREGKPEGAGAGETEEEERNERKNERRTEPIAEGVTKSEEEEEEDAIEGAREGRKKPDAAGRFQRTPTLFAKSVVFKRVTPPNILVRGGAAASLANIPLDH
ncbi:hypothetical protein NDU88_001970 [Pleurodeles waltl]|uniref:Uncharacterized protein n=1 Tax=Pleurodeles waltl TaxID=8319 RepID=A0AAV7MP63_PLEWA|nr:hypothetical protein NDU88_001970 [Pleurodeles waltl]